jgi:mono/diheme cytochrome c family protein
MVNDGIEHRQRVFSHSPFIIQHSPFMLVLGLLMLASSALAAGNPSRGKMVFTLAAGCNCHTAEHGPVGAGGAEVATPFGTFYGSNITPDRETGIGAWTDQEIVTAIRDGYARDKGAESPVMPYYQYAGMADADVADLIAYLRTLPAVRRPNRPHAGELPLARWAYRAWRLLFYRQPVRAAGTPSNGVARGAYLVDHVSLCADCHTPRTRLGALDMSLYLAGNPQGPGGDPVPNITPHQTGIAEWDAADIINVLRSGRLPNMDNVQGAMAEIVGGRGDGPGLKDAPQADLEAIAAYLKRVPPIDNAIDDK